MRKTITAVAILLQTLFTFGVRAETVHLSSAASMTDAVKAIVAQFTTHYPTITIRTNFASSGSLAKQIDHGAPTDVYISANPKWMAYLVEKRLIEPSNQRVFAHNGLVFIGMPTNGDLQLKDLVRLQRIAIGSPGSVPAGQYARQAMTRAGIYEELQQTGKLVMAKDVRQALIYGDRGEVDGAFVYATDAALADNAKILFTVPQHLYDPVTYPLGLTRTGAAKPEARLFYEYTDSGAARTILESFGFRIDN